jgi:hypothetical protein
MAKESLSAILEDRKEGEWQATGRNRPLTDRILSTTLWEIISPSGKERKWVPAEEIPGSIYNKRWNENPYYYEGISDTAKQKLLKGKGRFEKAIMKWLKNL